jgi:hypothetical protein
MQQIKSVITDIRPESTNKRGEVDVYRQGYLFNWTIRSSPDTIPKLGIFTSVGPA